jgi:hypothetical protein
MDAHSPEFESMVDLSRFKFVEGHVDISFAKRFSRRPFLMTCLRQPVDRALSHYHYYRGKATDREWRHEERTSAPEWTALVRTAVDAMTGLSLLEFVRRERELATVLLGNCQIRSLVQPDDNVGEAELSNALAVLDRCDLLLLTERLGDWQWISQRLGCGPLGALPRDNAAPSRPALESLDAATRDALGELTGLDQALYDHAVDLYERRVYE